MFFRQYRQTSCGLRGQSAFSNAVKERRSHGITPQRQAIFCKAIASGMTRDLACAFAKINTATFYRWMKKGEKAESQRTHNFFQAVTFAEAKGAGVLLDRIQKAAARGNWQAAAWMLERRYAAQYGSATAARLCHVALARVPRLAYTHSR